MASQLLGAKAPLPISLDDLRADCLETARAEVWADERVNIDTLDQAIEKRATELFSIATKSLLQQIPPINKRAH